MIDPVPAWIIRRYKLLWQEFGTDKFSFDDAKKVLKEDSKFVSVFLSELKKTGWVTVELDPTDSRKRVYQLKPMNDVIRSFVTSTFGEVAEGIKL